MMACVDQTMVELNTVASRQAFLQHRRKLLRELLPVVLPHLVLEAMQDLGRETRK